MFRREQKSQFLLGEWGPGHGINPPFNESGYFNGSADSYVYLNGNWRHESYIKANNTDNSDRFGTSVALSGDGKTLAVGADGEDSNSNSIGYNAGNNTRPESGAVYLY